MNQQSPFKTRSSVEKTGNSGGTTLKGCLQAFIALIVIAAIVSGIIWYIFFRPGPYAIKIANGQDYLWSVEPRQNNTSMVWFRNSELGAYCTANATLVAQLNQISQDMQNREIFLFFTYRSINNGDPEKQYLGTGDGCATEKGGVTIYRLESIKEVKPN